jgi:hypothetical protein
MVTKRSVNRRQARIPLDLELELAEYLEHLSKTTRIPRTTLCRMMIKYGIRSLSEVIANGDCRHWKPSDSMVPPT